jgi:salicylate hydroxylase
MISMTAGCQPPKAVAASPSEIGTTQFSCVQVANLTIEDAITLAVLLRRYGLEEFDEAMKHYHGLRRARTRVIQRSARATNTVLHLKDATEGRAAALAQVPERFGWIHAFDALADVTSRLAQGASRAQ